MNVIIADDQAVFALYAVTFDRSYASTEETEGMERRIKSFQKNATGILCFAEDELVRVERVLGELKVPYKVEFLEVDQKQKDKAMGKRYASRSEVIAHLKGEIDEPESEVIPNLKKKQREQDEKIIGHEATIRDLSETKEINIGLQNRIDEMEQKNTELISRMADLEAKTKAMDERMKANSRD